MGAAQANNTDDFVIAEGKGSSSLPVVLAAIVGIAVSAVLGWMLSVEHDAKVRRELDEQVLSAIGQLRNGYRMADEKLAAVTAFFSSSDEVTRAGFSSFFGALDHDPAVRGLGWAPIVTGDERFAYERSAGVTGFQFREWQESGPMGSRSRESYLPLYFAEPPASFADQLGIDFYSIPGRRGVLERSCDDGETVAVHLSEGPETNRMGLFRPVYQRGAAVDSAEQRRAALRGFVLAVTSLDGLLAPLSARLDAGLAVEISDEGGVANEPFFRIGPKVGSASARQASVTEVVDLGSSRWRVTFTPLPDYFAGRPNAQTWIGICLSLAFTTLVCAWIHSMAVRQRKVASVVEERTSELVIANAAMMQEVKVRRRAEQEIRQKTDELEAMNRELEAFSYSISHDLRAPLRAVIGFAGFVLRKHGEKLPADAVEHLEQVMKGGEQMNNLIEGLLQFSRIQRVELKRRNCDMAEMARVIMAELQSTMPERRVDVIWGRLPSAYADPTLLRQVWQNLLGNALKYSGKRASAVIEISSRSVDGETEYYVSDNGAGFDMSQADRLFGVFQRFHSQSQFEGTGIGLANVHKILQRHGGRISAEAEVDKGATFRFTLGSAGASGDQDDAEESTTFQTDTRIKK